MIYLKTGKELHSFLKKIQKRRIEKMLEDNPLIILFSKKIGD
jgi:hypothetical protein